MARKPPPDDGARAPGFSRRTFLKTAGAGAAVSTVVGNGAACTRKPTIIGPGAAPLTLRVNGASQTVTVEPRVTLLNALRNHLDLTGAKQVCDRGACGGCTVLLDGAPVKACMMLAADAEGHEITTVEGLGTPEKMSPLQEAFVEADALQCGFCTPGFVVSGTALLAKNPNPTLDEIKDGLAGNLCRCGTYSRIFEAVQKTAGRG
ncbi:MAG: (2Fe-2S)-binding protein [Acidobacteria bacterium]|jgi:xanthine dehydrogenase YagT iron-sulfur-binding subunit|nr:(2Fe-2S)-binding protein [Acidobacteriota bacterium]